MDSHYSVWASVSHRLESQINEHQTSAKLRSRGGLFIHTTNVWSPAHTNFYELLPGGRFAMGGGVRFATILVAIWRDVLLRRGGGCDLGDVLCGGGRFVTLCCDLGGHFVCGDVLQRNRRLSDRVASDDVLMVMSQNLAMIPGIVGYREINVRRRSYSYDI